MAPRLHASEVQRKTLTTLVCPYVLLGSRCTCECANDGKPCPHLPGLHEAITPELLHLLQGVRESERAPSLWLTLLASATDQLEQLLFVNGYYPWGNGMPISDPNGHTIVSEASMKIKPFFKRLGTSAEIRRFTDEMRDDLDALARLQLGVGVGLKIVKYLWISVVIGHSSDVNGRDRVRIRYMVSVEPQYAAGYHEALRKEKLHDARALHTLVWPKVWRRDGAADGVLYPTMGDGLEHLDQSTQRTALLAREREGPIRAWGGGRDAASNHKVSYWDQDARMIGVKIYTPAQFAEHRARQSDPDHPRSGSLTRPFEAPGSSEIHPHLLEMIRAYEARQAEELATCLVQDPPRNIPSSPRHRSTSSASLRPLLRQTSSLGALKTRSLVKKRSVTFSVPPEDSESPTSGDASTVTVTAHSNTAARKDSAPLPDDWFDRVRSSSAGGADLERPLSTDDASTSPSADGSTPSVARHNENVIPPIIPTTQATNDIAIQTPQPPKLLLKKKELERAAQTRYNKTNVSTPAGRKPRPAHQEDRPNSRGLHEVSSTEDQNKMSLIISSTLRSGSDVRSLADRRTRPTRQEDGRQTYRRPDVRVTVTRVKVSTLLSSAHTPLVGSSSNARTPTAKVAKPSSGPATAQPEIIERLSEDDENVVLDSKPPTVNFDTPNKTNKRKQTSVDDGGAESEGRDVQMRKKAKPADGTD